MRLFRLLLAGLACWALLAAAVPAGAEAPPDPLRLVPAEADLLVKVEQPRRLLEAFTTLDWVKDVHQIDALREFYDSTTVRRVTQLVTYFEKQLGAGWPDLLDRLTSGGAVLAVKFGANPASALLVVQGTDADLLRRFLKLALEVAEQELARREAKDRPERAAYRDIETVRVGKDFHAAAAGTALLISNSEKGLRIGLDLHLDGRPKSLAGAAAVAEARRLLPRDPLAWAWLNLETIRKAPRAKDLFALPNNNPALTVLFGGWLDVTRRSPFLCAGFYRDPDGFRTTFRWPRGREGMPEELAGHLPPAGQPGSLPFLEPKGVLASSSFFLDLARFWDHRAKLLNEQQLKGLEDFDKNSGRFLAGNQLSKLLAQAGAHQRIVVANQGRPGYQTVPPQRIPAFAYVVALREPEPFARSMEAILRGAALLAGTQVKLKLVEEPHGDHTIVGYRFPEDAKLRFNDNNFRFNFSPCFVTVGDRFVASSTLELCHELVDLLEKEAREKAQKGSPATVRTQFYAAGGAELLRSIEDQLLTQTILNQALSPKDARRQVQALIELVHRLGALQIEAQYEAQDLRYDVRLKMDK